MKYLEVRGVGFELGGFHIPLVPAAVIFDLLVGDGRVRPDAWMGYEAAQRASASAPVRGRIGAGRGATVAKLAGAERATDAGIGSASLRSGDLVVGALAVCNALGSVYERRTGERIAGPRGDDGRFLDDTALIRDFAAPAGANTTIGIVATNAALTKTQAKKMAEIAHDGLARAIHPVHTMLDGDTIFGVSTGRLAAPFDLVLTLAADAFSDAVVDAVRSAAGVT
jgi:L-aminopeptidase/D-esterase-like protein